jgi:hypothetical protein
MLFDWLVTGEVLPMSPAAAVRGPKHVVRTGKKPVLEGAEWRTLLDRIPSVTLRDLRDRALIATLTYSIAGQSGLERFLILFAAQHLFLRAHYRGAEDESRGPVAPRRRLDGAAP